MNNINRQLLTFVIVLFVEGNFPSPLVGELQFIFFQMKENDPNKSISLLSKRSKIHLITQVVLMVMAFQPTVSFLCVTKTHYNSKNFLDQNGNYHFVIFTASLMGVNLCWRLTCFHLTMIWSPIKKKCVFIICVFFWI